MTVIIIAPWKRHASQIACFSRGTVLLYVPVAYRCKEIVEHGWAERWALIVSGSACLSVRLPWLGSYKADVHVGLYSRAFIAALRSTEGVQMYMSMHTCT